MWTLWRKIYFIKTVSEVWKGDFNWSWFWSSKVCSLMLWWYLSPARHFYSYWLWPYCACPFNLYSGIYLKLWNSFAFTWPIEDFCPLSFFFSESPDKIRVYVHKSCREVCITIRSANIFTTSLFSTSINLNKILLKIVINSHPFNLHPGKWFP